MTDREDVEILSSWQARAVLEGFIEAAVAMLDVLDGEPDLEPEPDDEDDDPREVDDEPEEDDPSGQRDEDGVNTGGKPSFGWGGPSGAGCPISDPDAEHDGREPDDGY